MYIDVCLCVGLGEGSRSPGTEVTVLSCPVGCQELHPGPLEEQPMLLTNELSFISPAPLKVISKSSFS